MVLQFKLPNLVTLNEAKDIKETILASEPDAIVSFDFKGKIVKVSSQASDETIRQLITATGQRFEESGGDTPCLID